MYAYCRLCASKINSSSITYLKKLKIDHLCSFIYTYLDITENEMKIIACDLCCEVILKFNHYLKKLKAAHQKLQDDMQLEHDLIEQKLKAEIDEISSNDVKFEIDNENDSECVKNEFSNETQDDSLLKLEESNNDIAESDQNVPKTSKQPETLADIKTNAHKVRKIEFKCHKCNLMVQTADCLQNHFNTIHNSKPEYVCLKCNALFDDLNIFEKHLYEHYLRRISKYLRFTCEICGKKFKNKTSFTAHEDFHLGIKRFTCNDCGKQFRLKSQLTDHEFTTHKKIDKKEYKVKCSQCDKICNSSHLLERHMRTHIPVAEKYKYKCEKCDRKFVSLENYNNHQKLHENEKEKENICDHCGKIFKVKGNFLEHIRISHSNERPFSCDQCTKCFKSERQLKAHKTVHLDEKPYGCEVCGKKFRTKHNLEGHFAVHTEELPFECHYCYKRFKRKPCLKVHLRQHTGERPYSCTECNHLFVNSANFIKHIKRKHGLKNVSISNKFQYPFVNG